MLIRFEVANFRSILDPVELSMVAVDRDREAARPVDNLGESLLQVAAIFGPNASGKSNVIAALDWLRTAVQDSLRFWDDGIPMEPFAFHGGSDHPSAFTIESVVSGVRFEYVVELDRNSIGYEGLFHYPERKRRRVFEREDGELKLQRGLGKLSGTRELLTDRTLVLSIARRFDEPVVSEFANDLLSFQTLGLDPQRPTPPETSTEYSFYSPDQPAADANRNQVLALLKLADLGIDDITVDLQKLSHPARPEGETWQRKRIRLVHRTATKPVPLDLSSESQGTRTWFGLIGPVLNALRSGSLLLIDELDASLHPTLSMQLVRLFQDHVTNPAGAQLIFTSHDTSLLNHLNRDEVWLTEKSAEGMTRLGGLAEFTGERVRKSQNLERAYLHGRFGALPDIDRVETLRALGLIG